MKSSVKRKIQGKKRVWYGIIARKIFSPYASNRIITINGESPNASQWAERMGMKRQTLTSRLATGWDPVTAVLTPVIPSQKCRGVKRFSSRVASP